MMDEYLEWSTKKKKNGDVLIASFTCEGPEVRTISYDLLTLPNKTKGDVISYALY